MILSRDRLAKEYYSDPTLHKNHIWNAIFFFQSNWRDSFKDVLRCRYDDWDLIIKKKAGLFPFRKERIVQLPHLEDTQKQAFDFD